jgi:Fur family transcriptional regulator, zinc uptake regulator
MAHSHDGHRHETPPDLTRNQELVLQTLNGAEGPLSAYDILDRLRSEGLRAPLQIYRALEKLTAHGLAHRLESLNAFVCCAQAGRHGDEAGPTAFAICGRCGRVDEFTDEQVDERLAGWARAQGFVPTTTTIELRGTCRGCAAA